jgi:hypothetical protein
MAHDPKKVPDPSPTCPRCHYFEKAELADPGRRRVFESAWPLGIDQNKAQDLLTKAFPQKQRSYG